LLLEGSLRHEEQVTAADLDALDSVYRRAEGDWTTYQDSGYGANDFGADWRGHVRKANADLQRVRKLLTRASTSARAHTQDAA
jgi:hypothetical protein